jgi:hypothetical protein
MSRPRDDWDADEQDALEGLEDALADIRQRHADDPPLELLRAGAADALPPELQARVDAHLENSPWSRALVDGLRESGAGDRLDPETEQRLFERITREVKPAVSHRRQRAIVFGGLAIAASVLIAVLVSRSPAPSRDRDLAGDQTVAAPSQPPLLISYSKPEIKLSAAALTWRGDSSTSPFMRDLVPAFDAYRASDYARAVQAFDRLATVYPDAIEVRFYQGVSHMLAGDDAGGIAPLEAAARAGNIAFAEDVKWFLAVARQRSRAPGAREGFAGLCRGQSRYAAAACAAVTRIDAASSQQP